jgi:hypothetical protein
VSENSQGLKGVLEELQERKGNETDGGECAKGMASDPGSWAESLRRSCGNGLLGLIAREVVPKGTPRGPIFRFSGKVMCGYSLFTPGAQGTSPLWRYFCFLVFPDLGLLFSLLWTLPDGCRHLIPRT